MGLQRSAIASAVIAGAVIMAGAIAGAGSQGGLDLGGIPVMVLAAAIAFVVQWFAFLPAYWKQTEQFYDLVGSLTYLLVTGFVLVASRPIDARRRHPWTSGFHLGVTPGELSVSTSPNCRLRSSFRRYQAECITLSRRPDASRALGGRGDDRRLDPSRLAMGHDDLTGLRVFSSVTRQRNPPSRETCGPTMG